MQAPRSGHRQAGAGSEAWGSPSFVPVALRGPNYVGHAASPAPVPVLPRWLVGETTSPGPAPPEPPVATGRQKPRQDPRRGQRPGPEVQIDLLGQGHVETEAGLPVEVLPPVLVEEVGGRPPAGSLPGGRSQEPGRDGGQGRPVTELVFFRVALGQAPDVGVVEGGAPEEGTYTRNRILTMVRNFRMVKGRPWRPRRVWR